MTTSIQSDRSLAIATPLGRDALLLTGFSGREAISELFLFQLDLVAEHGTPVPFDGLLGQFVAFRLSLPGDGAGSRFVHGICSRMTQGPRGEFFTSYRMEVVPAFWFLTRRVQSRIFQHTSVPEILKEVLRELEVEFQVQGTFEPRDFCAQYNESDFAFASRLMEEEGIFYYFRHESKRHVLVLANTPEAHEEVTGGPSRIVYEEVLGEYREEGRILEWRKGQALRSGKVTLWDHCFEMPNNHLEAEKDIQREVQVGQVSHKLKIGQNDKLEIYEYPGAYAQRFDGVDTQGGMRPSELQKIFQDNARTVSIRMQQETIPGLVIEGQSDCGQLNPGHRFTLERHFDADGDYVLTSVTHHARLEGDYRSGGSAELKYANEFTCVPAALPFRPERRTPKPVVHGMQTAVVVGPPGEEIYPDTYGRVKVQFRWDREGKYDLDSSCWVRVSTPWAGGNWGMIHIPRIGQEVIVAFEHGDPDRPIIVGSVYNAEQGTPFDLPAEKVVSGIKSKSHKGGGYNELTFDDTGGFEKITIHGQFDMNTTVEHDQSTTVHNNRTDAIDVDDSETVGGNQAIKVGGDQSTTVGANQKLQVGSKQTNDIGANRATTIGGSDSTTISGGRTVKMGGAESLTIGGSRTANVAASDTLSVGASLTVNAGGQVTITAPAGITLNAGGSMVSIGPAGVTIVSSAIVTITGALVKVNS